MVDNNNATKPTREEILKELADRDFNFNPMAIEKLSDLELHSILLSIRLIEQYGSLQSGLEHIGHN